MNGSGQAEHGVLAVASAMTEAVCDLPAVATLDWGDRAAACLSLLSAQTRACLMIVTIDPSGGLLTLEATGVAGVGGVGASGESQAMELTIRSRAERLSDIGLRIDPSELDNGVYGTLSSMMSAGDWRSRGLGQLWAGTPVGDVVVGVNRLGSLEPGRVLIAQMSVSGPMAERPQPAITLMEVILPLLMRRALLAIGPRRTTSARWLTVREQQVLQELTLGKSVRQIADELGRSPHTIHDHVKSLHRKLNASSRGELVARALGYLDEGNRIREAYRPTAGRPLPEVKTTGAAAHLTDGAAGGINTGMRSAASA